MRISPEKGAAIAFRKKNETENFVGRDRSFLNLGATPPFPLPRTTTSAASPPPPPQKKTPRHRQALFLNRTATLARGVQGVGDALLSYGPPLAADLKADAAATAAGLAGVSFDPVTADW